MKLTVTTFLSLDGVMQSPGGPEEDPSDGFDLGGWLVPYADQDMGTFVSEWFARADSFLLGRRTYEIFAGYWPKVTDENDPVASKLNTRPKYVASKALDHADWANTTVLKGDLAEEVAKLKAQEGQELQVHGSGRLVQSLMRLGLIDEYRFWIYPVLLGKGRRLFEEGNPPSALRLTDVRTTNTGVVIHVYQPAGELKTGSFLSEQP